MMLNPNILDEGNQMEVLECSGNDMLDYIVRCNNCGKPTKYGETRMINGFVGCDNKMVIDGQEVECYFEDLMPRVRKCHDTADKTLYELYRSGKLYRWRDGADGGMENVK